MHYAPHMKLNHPRYIQWHDPKARLSVISQSGATLDKANEGATFTLQFRIDDADPRYISASWEVESDDATIYGEGSITIDCKQKGIMGEVIDFDGAFELPSEIIDRLGALGYGVERMD